MDIQTYKQECLRTAQKKSRINTCTYVFTTYTRIRAHIIHTHTIWQHVLIARLHLHIQDRQARSHHAKKKKSHTYYLPLVDTCLPTLATQKFVGVPLPKAFFIHFLYFAYTNGERRARVQVCQCNTTAYKEHIQANTWGHRIVAAGGGLECEALPRVSSACTTLSLRRRCDKTRAECCQ